ncbi:MAG TPA: alkaline phosphatase family protein [Steroidobacteraceae bacterium]|nr:alkaline phosphatase family protein [Steroidobacteraceae bacterium]
MSNRLVVRSALGVLMLVLAAGAPLAWADGSTPLKTRNVVLIVSDGLRWQEIFTGADPLLLNKENGGIWDKEADLRRAFWRDDVNERRKALFPFIWSTVAAHGQIFGNQRKGSIARVTNPFWFSYPGYNEMLSGHADPRINSNEFGPNPNITVFEWLNGLPDLHGQVAAFASWAAFMDIFNVGRSHLPVWAGQDLPYKGELSPREAVVNELFRTTTTLEDGSIYDSFVQVPLLDSFAKAQPRVLFVGYGETDDWGHMGRYDLLLHAAHSFDHYVEELWSKLQSLPAYRDQTTFILTADHGRGSGPVEWKEHGVEEKGSENVWIAVMGPDTAPLGERMRTHEVHQAQIAATVAALLGKDYRQAVPQAAPPIGEVLPGTR